MKSKETYVQLVNTENLSHALIGIRNLGSAGKDKKWGVNVYNCTFVTAFLSP